MHALQVGYGWGFANLLCNVVAGMFGKSFAMGLKARLPHSAANTTTTTTPLLLTHCPTLLPLPLPQPPHRCYRHTSTLPHCHTASGIDTTTTDATIHHCKCHYHYHYHYQCHCTAADLCAVAARANSPGPFLLPEHCLCIHTHHAECSNWRNLVS